MRQARNQREEVSKDSQSTSNVQSACSMFLNIWKPTHRNDLRYSVLRSHRHKTQTQMLIASCWVPRLAYSLTLKMEATCSSETLVDFQRTTRRYIEQDRTRLLMLFGRLVPSLFLVTQNGSLQIQFLLACVHTWLFHNVKSNAVIIRT
jgi:hypothetical protein